MKDQRNAKHKQLDTTPARSPTRCDGATARRVEAERKRRRPPSTMRARSQFEHAAAW